MASPNAASIHRGVGVSILVSVASFCDALLKATLQQAVAQAQEPQDLHFAVVDQSPASFVEITDADVYPARLSLVKIDPLHARGPCWARAIAMSFYRQEDWFFQIDSHMAFDPHWDQQLVIAAIQIVNRYGHAAISSYPSPFLLEDGLAVPKPTTEGALVHVLAPGLQFPPDHRFLRFEAHPLATHRPVSGFHLGAGCLFAPGVITQCLPYDPHFYFHGEEQAYALRLFSHGWSIWHIPKLPIYHLYNEKPDDTDAASPRRLLHWDKAIDEHRRVKWWDLEQASRKRFDALIENKLPGVFGLGSYFDLADYAQFSGIDYRSRQIHTKAFLTSPREPTPRAR